MNDLVKSLQLCAQDIAENAGKLLADVPYHQDCNVVIGLRDDEAPFVKVTQRYIPKGIVEWYQEKN